MTRTLGILFACLASACAPQIVRTTPVAVRAPLECSALPGTADLLASRSERYLVFGEVHGTREAPREFGEIVCEAAKQGPVVVSIERPPSLTGVMQDFVDSDGGAEPETALLAAYFDGSEWGLSSDAFLELFKRLRSLRASGAAIRIVGFQEGPPTGPDGDQTPYERGLARQLLNAAETHSDSRVLILVGNLHARRTSIPANATRPGFDPMAMHLPNSELLSFDLRYEAGEVYNCTSDGCGSHRVNPPGAQPRRIELMPGRGFDGVWAVGPVSAARPLDGRQ